MRLTGFEPAVYGLKARCHTTWLQTHILFSILSFSFHFLFPPYSEIPGTGVEPISTGYEPDVLAIVLSWIKVEISFEISLIAQSRSPRRHRTPFRHSIFREAPLI